MRDPMHHIYLFGHRQPDADSIASVIGYADFKNRSEPGRYIPARCGELNPETRFMLERFSIPEPVSIPSVKPKLSDITYKPVFSLPQDVLPVCLHPRYDIFNNALLAPPPLLTAAAALRTGLF